MINRMWSVRERDVSRTIRLACGVDDGSCSLNGKYRKKYRYDSGEMIVNSF